jgi:hypothetical protein
MLKWSQLPSTCRDGCCYHAFTLKTPAMSVIEIFHQSSEDCPTCPVLHNRPRSPPANGVLLDVRALSFATTLPIVSHIDIYRCAMLYTVQFNRQPVPTRPDVSEIKISTCGRYSGTNKLQILAAWLPPLRFVQAQFFIGHRDKNAAFDCSQAPADLFHRGPDEHLFRSSILCWALLRR